MTGYGKVVVVFKDKKISAEIKSLNSKQLDLQTRIAPLYREKEMEIRQLIAATLERGKVDFSLWIEKDAGVDATPVNAAAETITIIAVTIKISERVKPLLLFLIFVI